MKSIAFSERKEKFSPVNSSRNSIPTPRLHASFHCNLTPRAIVTSTERQNICLSKISTILQKKINAYPTTTSQTIQHRLAQKKEEQAAWQSKIKQQKTLLTSKESKLLQLEQESERLQVEISKLQEEETRKQQEVMQVREDLKTKREKKDKLERQIAQSNLLQQQYKKVLEQVKTLAAQIQVIKRRRCER